MKLLPAKGQGPRRGGTCGRSRVIQRRSFPVEDDRNIDNFLVQNVEMVRNLRKNTATASNRLGSDAERQSMVQITHQRQQIHHQRLNRCHRYSKHQDSDSRSHQSPVPPI